MIEPRELAHPDTALQSALVRALEENAMLRQALEERSLAPSARRWVGRTIAAMILAAGLLTGAIWATRSDNAREIRSAALEGYASGVRDGRAARASAGPPTPATAPTPPTAPSPPSPP